VSDHRRQLPTWASIRASGVLHVLHFDGSFESESVMSTHSVRRQRPQQGLLDLWAGGKGRQGSRIVGSGCTYGCAVHLRAQLMQSLQWVAWTRQAMTSGWAALTDDSMGCACTEGSCDFQQELSLVKNDRFSPLCFPSPNPPWADPVSCPLPPHCETTIRWPLESASSTTITH
jgi:hypothetical protein